MNKVDVNSSSGSLAEGAMANVNDQNSSIPPNVTVGVVMDVETILGGDMPNGDSSGGINLVLQDGRTAQDLFRHALAALDEGKIKEGKSIAIDPDGWKFQLA